MEHAFRAIEREAQLLEKWARRENSNYGPCIRRKKTEQ
jgi:hypothetical protein